MNYKNIDEVISDSIQIYEGMISVYPQFRQESIISIMEIVPKFNGDSVYCVNNSTVAFIINGHYYVTPYTRAAISIICEYCHQNYFYVPFSNCDYPKQEEARWTYLMEKARESREEDFKSDCETWCDEHHIKELPQEVLEQCFKIPAEGVEVKHPYYTTRVEPILNSTCVDCTAVDTLGKFCTNNGRVVFVYRDSSTYVAKGYGIICMLRMSGYKEGGLFVPFSNGEVITDEYLQNVWENLKKF